MRNFPHFTQLDAMDCGPASLKIIAKYYGKNISMKYIRDICHSTKEGGSLLDLSKAASEIGLRSLALKVTFDDLLSHFVVLYKLTVLLLLLLLVAILLL